MKSVLAASLVAVGIGAFVPAYADTIASYPDPGTPNTAIYIFRALATGDVTGFFAGASAADTSEIGLSVNGASPLLFGLSNQTSAVSQSLDFGPVVAGDLLSFKLNNLSTATQLSSVATSNQDRVQHVYAASFFNTGGPIPTGLQISFEDLTKSQGSDFDYNDASFVFTNVADDPEGGGGFSLAPVPAALSLFLGGVGAFAFIARLGSRRHHRSRRSAIAS